MTNARAVISDFGGVLTTPLAAAFRRFSEGSGVTLEELGVAMAAVGAERGENPLFTLETGKMSEAEFMAALSAQLTRARGHEVSLAGFGETLFSGLHPNEEFVAFMRVLRGRGHPMAICTNNVREWSARWQAMIPVAELFDVVIDSSELGVRKPDPRIYQATLAALGVAPESAVFIDDLQINCEAAAGLGMRAVWFQETEQAITDVEAALDGDGAA
ncbi:MAG TPA: HAD family phosphatase [Solirubrobacteraceae bacterium]|nr:HAD family phosphatase [Solirubrobacteraceae bacterium]